MPSCARRRRPRRPVAERRLEALGVLRRVPAIASLAIVNGDGDGRERLFLSRVDFDRAAGGDRSVEPAVIEARATGVWFGSVTFAGGSEPFMSVAVGAIAARPASSSRRSISSSSGS
jgi:hypothetical protein